VAAAADRARRRGCDVLPRVLRLQAVCALMER
jgi:hypothetical protein